MTRFTKREHSLWTYRSRPDEVREEVAVPVHRRPQLLGVVASLNARKDQLSTWRASGRDDTEQLRAAVHGYRDFLTHLVGP